MARGAVERVFVLVRAVVGAHRVGRAQHHALYGARQDLSLLVKPRDPSLIDEAKDDAISIEGDEFKVLSKRDPAELPWKALGVDVVFESTGLFTNREAAADAGASPKAVREARADLLQGDAESLAGRFEQAAYHYREAWTDAQRHIHGE